MNCLFVSVSGKYEFLAEQFLQLMSHLSKLIYLHPRCCVNQGPEVLVHILRRTKLLNSLKSAVELVAQYRYYIEARDHTLFIDKCLSLH